MGQESGGTVQRHGPEDTVEELCDNIALINKSRLVIAGGVDEIRHKYGNNHIELVYSAPEPVVSVPGCFRVLSDQDESGRHTAVLAADGEADRNTVLRELVSMPLTVHSYKELVPRMNDIFIKLVTEE